MSNWISATEPPPVLYDEEIEDGDKPGEMLHWKRSEPIVVFLPDEVEEFQRQAAFYETNKEGGSWRLAHDSLKIYPSHWHPILSPPGKKARFVPVEAMIGAQAKINQLKGILAQKELTLIQRKAEIRTLHTQLRQRVKP